MNGKLIIAAAASLSLMAGAASAQTMSNLYLKGFGGANWAQDQGAVLNGAPIGDVDYDSGYTLGAALGYDYTPNFAIESEYGFRSADFDTLNGDFNAHSLMFNGVYTLDGLGPNGAWRPYAGAGVGMAFGEAEVAGVSYDNDPILAYQAFGGVGYEVSPQLTLFGEGRYFGTEETTLDGPGVTTLETKWESWDVLIGASYRF